MVIERKSVAIRKVDCETIMIGDIDFLTIFKDIIEEIKCEYLSYNFFTERDFEWIAQKRFWELIRENNLPYEVFSNHPIEKGATADLAIVKYGTPYKAILQGEAKAELIVEFKFEPSKHRKVFCKGKLEQAVVFWSEVNKDIDRINRFIYDKKTKSAVSMLIDEYGRHKDREIGGHSQWINWGSFGNNVYNIHVLWTEISEKG